MSSITIIAEIGINHNGDISIAKRLIKEAKECGADAVKFQKRTISDVYSTEELDTPRESPWGTTNRQQKEGLEFGEKEYNEIDSYCKELNISWSASAWDLKSQAFLQKYNLSFNKVASALLTHKELLEMISKEGKHTYISTGMSTLQQIEAAVEIFKQNNCPFELMHCNSSYPMKVEEANLRNIPMLQKTFNCNVGYSGHETGLSVSYAAAALGATSIERHITLDRSMYGSDQSSSVEPTGFKRLCENIRCIEKAMGCSERIVHQSEQAGLKKLRKVNTLGC